MSTELFAPVCSITMTKRRRFFWAAWWTGPPTRVPFKKPDASDGGAASYDAALAAAEARAGRSLVVIDALWAKAWIRVLRGEPVWPSRASREPIAPKAKPALAPESVWAVLGVTADATEADLKAAYRRRAVETHPDQGGDEESFRRVLRAYEEAKKRLRRPKRKP